MGGGSSREAPSPDQSSKNDQRNHNRVIDQSTGAAWFQLNWASFGGGVSSILIITVLVILLYICWRNNKRANHKARKAELHELATIMGRRGFSAPHRNSTPPPRPPPYPGLSRGFPGSPPVPIHGLSGAQFDGFGSAAFPTVQLHGGFGSGLPAIAYQGGQFPVLSGLPSFPEWSPRIRELPAPAARPRVTYAARSPEPDEIQVAPAPESILRTPRTTRRSVGSGMSRSASLRSINEIQPAAPRTGVNALLDQIEAEENAAQQF